MPVLLFIMYLAGMACIGWFITGVTDTLRRKKDADCLPSPTTVPFSVTDYLDRMEKLHLKALQERENEQPHIIVLWWGFDGLRLNADGTREWISRRPKENKATFAGDMFSVPYLTLYDSANYLQPTTLDDCSATWKIPSTEERIAALQSQLQAVNMQQWQNEQIQSMINIYGKY